MKQIGKLIKQSDIIKNKVIVKAPRLRLVFSIDASSISEPRFFPSGEEASKPCATDFFKLNLTLTNGLILLIFM